MFWRNRLERLTPYRTSSPLNQESPPTPPKKIQIHFLKKHSQESLLTTLPFPEDITLQAHVTLVPEESSDALIYVDDHTEKISLYESPTIPVFNTLMLTGIPASCSKDWHPDLINALTSCFFEKNFDTLKRGVHIYETDQKKLSESKKTGQLTLWSYGATYSMDHDPCQLAQTLFYPLFLNKEIKLRYRRSCETLLSIAERGQIIIPIPDSSWRYQSKSCARITQNVIQMTFTKCGDNHDPIH